MTTFGAQRIRASTTSRPKSPQFGQGAWSADTQPLGMLDPCMKDPRPQPIYRRDYRPPDYWIDTVDLRFELGDELTLVTATLAVRRNEHSGPGPKPLELHGEKLELRSVSLDGRVLEPSEYQADDKTLRIASVPARFELTTTVAIKPQHNTELEGLYRSGSTFCTQCEAEGFRKITYFLDRPDVMSRYTTTIEADAKAYPVLLSNGNRVDEGSLENGRHFVKWEDPFPKPSYLFALVAADLRCHAGTYTTKSGRDVALEIWVEPQNVDACEHALESLKKSMKWDEETFGLEYDLDIYMIVAVRDFNMGAMENKGLNVFNEKFILARPETATDDDYEAIEGVVAHEYFHNWTGNRVTCRDWFQLTLKEGLTVFRDEQFTADMTSAAVKRIQDVRILRTAQFAEDQSPTAHPIRPDSYIEMNNFYTVTVYNKGAEVVRMYHTLLGPEGFRKGMDLYFERHDGNAVTCDDFRAAMADANGVDLDQFARWYTQAGTPVVEAEGTHDPGKKTYTLTLRQRAPANVDAEQWQPMHVPLSAGLVGPDGDDLRLDVVSDPEQTVELRDTSALLELKRPEQRFVFRDVEHPPVPSLLRGFSAPVKLRIERSIDELAFLIGHDSDPFCRWDAAQSLAQALLLESATAHGRGQRLDLDPRFIEAWGKVLTDPELDGSLKALTLTLPDERLLGQAQDVVDVDGLYLARQNASKSLAQAHGETLRSLYDSTAAKGSYSNDQGEVTRRRLRNTVLGLMVRGDVPGGVERALQQYRKADNMTDAQAALECLVDTEGDPRIEALQSFHEKWKGYPLVIDKWFAVQALSSRSEAVDAVMALWEHPDFTPRNPNRVRALVGTFAVRNQTRFHGSDGRGYGFVADKILELDKINPQVSARLVSAFSQWRRFDSDRQAKMKAELRRIVNAPKLSTDVYELASKMLGRDPDPQ